MRVVVAKPTLKMTCEEYEIISNFITIMESADGLRDMSWSDIFEDFPMSRPDTCYNGTYYNVEIEDN